MNEIVKAENNICYELMWLLHHFVNKSAPTGPHNECVESGCQNNSLLSNVRGRLNSSCSEPVELAPVKEPDFTQSMRCCDWTECWQTRHLLQFGSFFYFIYDFSEMDWRKQT